MKWLKIILILVSLQQTLYLKAQHSFIKSYKDSIVSEKKQIRYALKGDPYLFSLNDSNSIINTFPTYTFRAYNMQDFASDKLSNLSFYKDYIYSILYRNSKVVGFGQKRWGSEFDVFPIEDLDSSELHIYTIKQIEFAKRFSDIVFFINFFRDYELNRPIIVGFIKGGHIHCVDTSLNIYKDISEVVLKRFGSLEKYIELNKLQQIQKNLWQEAISGRTEQEKIEKETEILRKDYLQVTTAMGCVDDTLKIFNLFLDEMNSIIKLGKDQASLLKQRIFEGLKNDLPRYSEPGIYFFNKNIYSEVNSVLTEEQCAKYMKQRNLNEWLGYTALKGVEHYYLSVKKISIDSLNKVYKEKIFKCK